MKEWLTALLISAIAALAPIQATLITVGVLIFVDAFTGMYASYKRKEPITSAVMRRTISKLLVYQTVIISGYLLEHNILDHILPIAKMLAGACGVVEFKSILENSNSIMGADIFKSIISKLGSDNDIKPKG